MSSSGNLIVASIDLGTTFSGYAYSLGQDREEIYTNNWEQDAKHKAPSSVLLSNDGQFIDFGFDAERKYNCRVSKDGPDCCEMFRHFKMVLHEQKHLSRKIQIQSVRGTKAKAMDIFIHALKFLKDHLLQDLDKRIKRQFSADDINWVVTVPAIWSERSKRFMREVAFKGGLISDKESRNLVICLEPEAASIYCRNITTDIDNDTAAAIKLLHSPGTKYIIVDAGGGTIDVGVHEILEDKCIREINRASGGAWGGIRIDENFITMLTEILGEDFMIFLQQRYPEVWLDIRTKFENQKGAITLDNTSEDIVLTIDLPFGMDSKYNEATGGDIRSVLKNISRPGISFENGKIFFCSEALTRLYKESLESIISHVSSIEETHPDIKLILLTGGLGGSKVVYNVMQKRFSKQKGFHILCPHDPTAAVMKGAVMYGINPEIIKFRIARKSYGTDVMVPFNPRQHPEERKILNEKGEGMCEIFKPFVRIGESIPIGHKICKTYRPFASSQEYIKIPFYASDCDKHVVFMDDPTLMKVGELCIMLPVKSRSNDSKAQLTLFFGLTEIFAECQELCNGKRTGDRFEVTFELLSGDGR